MKKGLLIVGSLILLGVAWLYSLKSPCKNCDSISNTPEYATPSAGTDAPEIPIATKPRWVKEQLVPYEWIDSFVRTSDLVYNTSKLYQEYQINIDKEEIFTKTVYKVNPSNTNNVQNISLSYSSKDMDRQIIDVSVKKGKKEINVTQHLNWNEVESKEYVFNRLWESHKSVNLSIDKLNSGDIYSVSYLDKSFRKDIHFDEGIFYKFKDSSEVYLRVVSNQALNYKPFNGFPEVKVVKHNNYYEYIARGFAVTPFKGDVPDNFISLPFIVLTKFEKIEQVGESFKDQLIVNESSKQVLDTLFSQLTEGALNDSIRIKNIVNYVQDTIVYQDYGLTRSYQPNWCIQGNRGDCKAKSFIMIELLKRAGLKAYPVLVNAPSYISQLDTLPSTHNFNHLIVQFHFKGETIIIDPTHKGETDKIGAYPLSEFDKGLVIYDDRTEFIDMVDRHKGRVEIVDEIFSDTIKRKICISGGLAEIYKNNRYHNQRPESLFTTIFRLDQRNYVIHDYKKFYYKKTEMTDLEVNSYNSISQDSIVLTQKMYYPDSVITKPFIRTKDDPYSDGTGYSSMNYDDRDTIYTGGWPLKYINQSTVAIYYKDKIPLDDAIDLSSINNNFVLEQDFGHYRCTIEEDETKIIVKQDIFVSGALPRSRLVEHDIFMDQIKARAILIRDLIVAKDPE